MTIKTNPWTNPHTGETRHYINGFWSEMLGLEVTKHKTGTISHASIDGEKISNNSASLLSGKLWADKKGNLHLDHFFGGDFYSEEEALERIKAHISANGGLDFLNAPKAPVSPDDAPRGPVFSGTLTPEEILMIESKPTEDVGGLYYSQMMERPDWAKKKAQIIAAYYDVEEAEIIAAYLTHKGLEVPKGLIRKARAFKMVEGGFPVPSWAGRKPDPHRRFFCS